MVMKNGEGYWHCHLYPNGPATALNEHDGELKYVSMNCQKERWIVGFGENGYKSRGLNNVHKDLSGVLDGVAISCTLDFVEIGKDTYYLRNESGGESFAISQDANSYIKKAEKIMECVTLW